MKKLISISACGILAACAGVIYEEVEENAELATDMSVPAVQPAFETEPVISADDAADDPAFVYFKDKPEASFILGTDKRSGLVVYNLAGKQVGFLPIGRVNNVDVVRQAISSKETTIAMASNRTDNTVSVIEIGYEDLNFLGGFKTVRKKPYGFCAAEVEGKNYALVTHKEGMADLYVVTSLDPQAVKAEHLQSIQVGGQLEGCVFDVENMSLVIGEEEAAVHRFPLQKETQLTIDEQGRSIIDVINGENGLVADIEGISLYKTSDTEGYFVVSSQGNNTYAIYDRQTDQFLGRFRVENNSQDDIVDATQETDGLDVLALPLPGHPKGVLVVQDGFNKPEDENQNFKVIDWVEIEQTLSLN